MGLIKNIAFVAWKPNIQVKGSFMKEYRKIELKNYVIGNILVIILFSGVLDLIYVHYGNDIVVLNNSALTLLGPALLSPVLYIYVYIVDSMVPSKFKDTFVYFLSGRPGDTVFEEILKPGVDARFTPDDAKEKYKDFYAELNQVIDKKQRQRLQNTKWYRIYQTVESNETVSLSQQDFLLNRDMCIITIAILLLYVVFSLFSGFITIRMSVIVWMIIETVVTKFAASSKAKRFALNVITKDIHKKESDASTILGQ